MPSKDFELADGLVVSVYKRRGNRNLRLSVVASGKVRVSIPAWAPYRVGVDFAKSRQAWIVGQSTQQPLLKPGQAIGKAHHLEFMALTDQAKVTSQVRGTTITIRHPLELDPLSPAVQKLAQTASLRSLRNQAKQLLPQRLDSLASQHGFNYNGVTIKQLTGRWGSCDHHRRIVLSLFLMQLPWELIDYVLLHELTHTLVLRHGPDFWQAFQAVLPDAKARKKQLQAFRPVLVGQPT